MNYKIEQKLDEWSFKVEQENLITWSNVLNDPNPIHLDNKTVKKLGLGDKCINQGPANIAYILNCISSNFKNYQLIEVKNKLNGNVFSGDKIVVEGKISDIENHENFLIISLLLVLNTQNQSSVLLTEAKIRIPNH